MRILFINQYDERGGAAVVARRLNRFLSAQEGVACRTLVAYKSSDEKTIFPIRTKPAELAERVVDRVLNKVGFQYQFLPFSFLSILGHAKQFCPDIINLHNSHGGYFQTSLLKKLSSLAPVVWTLHDMWSFTGNSAHTFGDESWRQLKNTSHLTSVYPAIGINRGEQLLRQKQKIYRQSDLTMITPSQWLRNLAAQSPVFNGKQIVHINNGIDLSVFRAGNRDDLRDQLDIPRDARVLMFSAESVKGNPWKGGSDLGEVVKLISEQSPGEIHLIITGGNSANWLDGLSNLIVHRTGYIADEHEMARCLSASDVFLYPTRADNLPNVLIEAIACGTPCVTFDVGGCKEIIQHDHNGIVTPPGAVRTMAEQVLSLLNDSARLKRYAIEARHYAEQYFSIELMGKKYLEIFESLNKRQTITQ